MSMPRLLNNCNTPRLPETLLKDLQLDQILSAQTLSVLRQPCKQDEMVRRNELFLLLDKDENHGRIEHTLTVLSAHERALRLLNDAKIAIERYYRRVDAMEAYLASCSALTQMHDLGVLFAEVAHYFASEEKKSTLESMMTSVEKIKNLLRQISTGLLSFADKHWLTPDGGAVCEHHIISTCAENLGFEIPKKKPQNIKINDSLSDAICRLHRKEIQEIETEISLYADVDFYEPLSYISEIKFFLDINNLIRRATELCVPHCISQIANVPQYNAKALYDISLLAKHCQEIIPNDADFNTNESFFFLLGANGGGKTTYLRAVGINLLLFLAGCPVFAKEAQIFPFDILLSHFPKDERFDNIGRLDEELNRTHEMLNLAQSQTAFLLFNETFSGTDDRRGFHLLKDVTAQICKEHHFGLYVTHFHEVMTLDYPVLSAEVDSVDANKRTFHIVKSKGNASSYASDILKKYGLDKDTLAARRCGHGH